MVGSLYVGAGRHKGKSYLHMLEHEKYYCSWVVRAVNPVDDTPLAEFSRWLFQKGFQPIESRRKAAVPPRPARPEPDRTAPPPSSLSLNHTAWASMNVIDAPPYVATYRRQLARASHQ